MATRLGVVINLESKYKLNIAIFENFFQKLKKYSEIFNNLQNFHCLNPDSPDSRIYRIAKFPSVEGQVCHLACWGGSMLNFPNFSGGE
ncbi:hypothetical protein R83H12_02369 [Fibrobacteria bacterium R8-3-H12]